jgi:hypothetical protein
LDARGNEGDAPRPPGVKEPLRDTKYLAVSVGCYIQRDSALKDRVVDAYFLMDKAGQAAIANVTYHEPGPTAQITYLAIVGR